MLAPWAARPHLRGNAWLNPSEEGGFKTGIRGRTRLMWPDEQPSNAGVAGMMSKGEFSTPSFIGSVELSSCLLP